MTSLFRARGGDGSRRLNRDLAALEEQARTASSGYETQFLNRAGNLCVEQGQPQRALEYFGRAIDAYLESGRFSAAEVLCRKLLQISPRSVRTRCTLAWLALGKGFEENTRAEIAEYADAAEREGQQALATRQLMLMAEAATDTGLRREIGRHLLRLEAVAEADHLFGIVFEEENGLRPPASSDESKLWARLLRGAMMGPEELHRQETDGKEEESDALPSLSGDGPN